MYLATVDRSFPSLSLLSFLLLRLHVFLRPFHRSPVVVDSFQLCRDESRHLEGYWFVVRVRGHRPDCSDAVDAAVRPRAGAGVSIGLEVVYSIQVGGVVCAKGAGGVLCRQRVLVGLEWAEREVSFLEGFSAEAVLVCLGRVVETVMVRVEVVVAGLLPDPPRKVGPREVKVGVVLVPGGVLEVWRSVCPPVEVGVRFWGEGCCAGGSDRGLRRWGV